MKADARPVFDVAPQVLLRDLHPFNPDDYEVVYSGTLDAAAEKARRQLGCDCADCLRHRQVGAAKSLNWAGGGHARDR